MYAADEYYDTAELELLFIDFEEVDDDPEIIEG